MPITSNARCPYIPIMAFLVGTLLKPYITIYPYIPIMAFMVETLSNPYYYYYMYPYIPIMVTEMKAA